MSISNKKNLSCIVNWGNGIALLFSALGVLVVGVIVFMLFSKTPPINSNVNKFEVHYSISMDTIQLKKLKDLNSLEYLKYIEENNKKIATDLEQKMNDEYQRLQKLVELKEEQNIYNTYGAGIIALILAVGSFFGFKSINEMRKNAIDTAEEEAKKVAEVKAKEVAEEEAKKVAEVKAKEVAEEEARKVAELKAKEVAESVSKQEINVQTKIIEKDLEKMLKELLLAENKIVVAEELKTKTEDIAGLQIQVSDLLSRLEQASKELDKNSNSGTNKQGSEKIDTGEDDDVEFKLEE